MSRAKKPASTDLKDLTRAFLHCSDHLHTLCRLEINDRLAKQDIKYSQWLILDCLNSHDIDSPSKVASQLGMERATVSRSLDILESRALVKRTHNTNDRRVVEIDVTAQGRKIATMGAARLEQVTQTVVADMTTKDVKAVSAFLATIRSNILTKIGR